METISTTWKLFPLISADCLAMVSAAQPWISSAPIPANFCVSTDNMSARVGNVLDAVWCLTVQKNIFPYPHAQVSCP